MSSKAGGVIRHPELAAFWTQAFQQAGALPWDRFLGELSQAAFEVSRKAESHLSVHTCKAPSDGHSIKRKLVRLEAWPPTGHSIGARRGFESFETFRRIR